MTGQAMDAGQGCEVTRLCLRLAERFRAADVSHPVAAAASVTARGLTGLDPAAFSRRHSLEPSDIAAGEAGEVAFGDLPGAVGTILEGSGKVCLLQLADLDLGYRTDREGERDRVDAFRRTAYSWAFDQAVLPAEVPAAYLVPHQSFTAKAVGAEMAAHRVIQAFLQPEPPVRLPPAAR